MNDTIQINELADMITRELEEYIEEVEESMDAAANMVSKELLSDIKEDSPEREGSGQYKKSWTRKKQAHSYIVHNKKYWWLTHLLENGHNAANGKRVRGTPHIFKNADRAVRNYEDMCVAIISEGVRFK